MKKERLTEKCWTGHCSMALQAIQYQVVLYRPVTNVEKKEIFYLMYSLHKQAKKNFALNLAYQAIEMHKKA